MLYSNNPEDWKLECGFCGELIVYKEKSFKEAKRQQEKNGKIPKCKKCIIKLRKGAHPPVKYSFNPEDWVLKCQKCDRDIIYKKRPSYCQAAKKIQDGKLVQCRSCAATGYKHTDASKLKMKNKVYTEADREKFRQGTIRRNSNMTEEERLLNKLKMKEVNKRTWDNMDPDKRKRRIDDFQERIRNLPTDVQVLRYEKIRNKCIERLIENGGLYNFKPAYNKKTIPYIVDILNIRYNTEFIHAESGAGEFKIYDSERSKFYYADAYCQKLNIWIEFDEVHHNRATDIEFDQIREDRIRTILGCQVLRISFDKHIY